MDIGEFAQRVQEESLLLSEFAEFFHFPAVEPRAEEFIFDFSTHAATEEFFKSPDRLTAQIMVADLFNSRGVSYDFIKLELNNYRFIWNLLTQYILIHLEENYFILGYQARTYLLSSVNGFLAWFGSKVKLSLCDWTRLTQDLEPLGDYSIRLLPEYISLVSKRLSEFEKKGILENFPNNELIFNLNKTEFVFRILYGEKLNVNLPLMEPRVSMSLMRAYDAGMEDLSPASAVAIFGGSF